MNDIFRDLTSIAMAVVGVAILAVLVSQNSQTSSVIGSSASGFAQVLQVAMGGAANNVAGIHPVM